MSSNSSSVAPTWAGQRKSRIAEVSRTTIAPLLLVLVTPPTVVLFWIACTYLDGSLLRLLTAEGLAAVVDHFPRPSLVAVEIIVLFAAFELALLKLLPGKSFDGPVTPTGNQPRYKLNGILAWLVSHGAFFGASYGLGWFSPAIVFDHFGELLVTLSASCFGFCWFLYFKGIHAPSTPDAGASGNVAMDYFWGVELHPTLFGVNLKQLFNCRISMMGWSLTVISFAARQRLNIGHVSTSMLVCSALLVAYLLKFFSWESGYLPASTSCTIASDTTSAGG